MSITNIVEDRGLIILQAVNGICLFEESWMRDAATKQKHLDAMDTAMPDLPKNTK